jgi:2-succinyl-6-hydroxy-2,4-cyclohexadiene-1-carboxylate synthase
MKNFFFLIDELKDTVNFLYIDLPGHGNSSVIPQIELDKNFYPTLKTILSPIKNKIFFDYSLGGRVIMEYCLNYPQDFVESIIIESSNPGLENNIERQSRAFSDKHLLDEVLTYKVNFNEFLDVWYSNPIFGQFNKHPDYQEQKNSIIEQGDLLGLQIAVNFFSIGTRQNFWNDINQLFTSKSLYLSGAFDHKFSAIGERLASLNSMIQHKTIPQAGHNIHQTNRKVFANTIKSHIESLFI